MRHVTHSWQILPYVITKLILELLEIRMKKTPGKNYLEAECFLSPQA